MKLSEVIKDWPEKKDDEIKHSVSERDYDGNVMWTKSVTIKDNESVGYNTALTSCDREIDREALWKLIVSRSVYHNFDSDKDNFITVPLNDLTDLIISTMPTWLKRIE